MIYYLSLAKFHVAKFTHSTTSGNRKYCTSLRRNNKNIALTNYNINILWSRCMLTLDSKFQCKMVGCRLMSAVMLHVIMEVAKRTTFPLSVNTTYFDHLIYVSHFKADGLVTLHLKIEYHAVGDTWWQPLLSYGKWCTELDWFIHLLILSTEKLT